MISAQWYSASRVTSLLDCSLQRLMEHLPCNLDKVSLLPANLKDRIVHLMCKRGILSDHNIDKVLHNKLRVLDLSECDISDVGLVHIANKCTLLTKLDLNSNKVNRTAITAEGVTRIAGRCRHLQVVYLRRCLQVNDAAVQALAEHCRQLRDLNIGGCRFVTDDSLISLGDNSHHLKSINLSGSNITDAGVFRLVSGACANSLKELHVNGCKSLTDDAIEVILDQCPHLNILLIHNCPKLTEKSRHAIEIRGGNRCPMKQITWTIY